ncbi:MAG: pilin [Minisyncoccales bacterium]
MNLTNELIQTLTSNRKITIIILFVILGLISLFPTTTQASTQASGASEFKLENPLKYSEFKDLINAIINFLFNIALIVAPLFIIIAGFYFVTAAGDPQKIETAKKIILYTFIGLLIIIASKGLIAFIQSILGVSE